jgi:DNA-binding response OmpR family regulator
MAITVTSEEEATAPLKIARIITGGQPVPIPLPVTLPLGPQAWRDHVVTQLRQISQRPLCLKVAGLSIDLGARMIHGRDDNGAMHNVILTEKEAELIAYLWHSPGPVAQGDLLRDVWRYAPTVDTHTIETHVYRLRQKLAPLGPVCAGMIVTHDGGYHLSTAVIRGDQILDQADQSGHFEER